jgi:hypothetical protein
MWMRLRCQLGERHVPVRHPLGAFRCARCGKWGADLDELGFEGEGYLSDRTRRHLDEIGAHRAA